MSKVLSTRDDRWLSLWRDRSLLGYAFACLAVGAATFLFLLLREPLRWHPTVVFVGAVSVSAFVAGVGPSLLATLLSVAVIEFAFFPPPMGVELHEIDDLLVLTTFAGVGGMIGLLAEQVESGRHEMERRARRSGLLSEATRLMGEASSYEEALRKLPEFLCREMADLAITYEVDPEGGEEVRRVGGSHASPGRQSLLNRLLEHRPLTLEDGHGAGAVIQSGEPILVEEIPDSTLEEAAGEDEAYLQLLRCLDPTSAIIVPLQARDRTIGALAAVTTGRSDRRYDEEDLDLMLDLAHHAALVLDNRRLLDEARTAIRTREGIMAVVAHDLRNPLSTIRMAADGLSGYGGGEVDSDEVAERLQLASERCLHLVDNLVDVSRMDAGAYHVDPRPVPVRRLLEDVSEFARLIAERGDVRLTMTADGAEGLVRADRESIERVFSNLIDNACQFSPGGGTVHVTVRPGPGEVVFSVTDDGPGIPDESMPHIFEKFWAGDADGDSGLGLAIVRDIVEAHGGRVWAESEDGRGARISFSLPRAST